MTEALRTSGVPGRPGWHYGLSFRAKGGPGFLTVEVYGPEDERLAVTGSPYWLDLPEMGHPTGIHSLAREAIDRRTGEDRARAREARRQMESRYQGGGKQ